MRICVYGAASPTIDPEYIKLTEIMGEELAKRGHSLVFGGGASGLMGAAARGVRKGGGSILGVIPKFFDDENIEAIYTECNEMLTPDTMRERKQLMEDNADAFIITPGGIGTYEEFFEILTLKQLCRHNKPIAIYNIMNYYDGLNEVIQQAMQKNFIRENCNSLFITTDNLDELFAYIEAPVDNTLTVKQLKDG
ncbi:MAG: TIGR00730 family Rossman fold protein [Clostridia bacterium]|nr:TIGR00730 family Rossman fold protein [Clostridia bacterium]